MANSTEEQQFISAELELNTVNFLQPKAMSSTHFHRAVMNLGPD